MTEILTEIEDSNEQERTTMNAINGGQANFERKAEFLNKEISFLLDNLRRVSFNQINTNDRKRQTMDLMRILYYR